MTSTERAGDALARWIVAAEQDAREADELNLMWHPDPQLFIAVLAVVQAAEAYMEWEKRDEANTWYHVGMVLLADLNIALAALRALVGDAS